jgi:hypothetical protein
LCLWCFFIVKAFHCPCMPSPPSSSFSYGLSCSYHGLFIVIASKYPPSPFWFWWSCGLGHHYGLFVAIIAIGHPPCDFHDLVVLVIILVFLLLQPTTTSHFILSLMILWSCLVSWNLIRKIFKTYFNLPYNKKLTWFEN